MTLHLGERMLHDLQQIVGEECWAVVGGEGTGSVISLNIGARTLRTRPLHNPHLTELSRLHTAAYTLMIWCPWRIDSLSKVIAGSHMLNANDGPMVSGLKEICGNRIVNVVCAAPAYDMTIHFENRRSLVVHCSDIDLPDDRCYSFGTPRGDYGVYFDGKVVREE